MESDMKHLFLKIILTSVALNIACLFQVGQSQTNAERQTQEDDIRETIFRHLFDHNASGLQQKAAVYFLSLGRERYPSEEFLERFKDHKPTVKSAIESSHNARGVVDKKTGKPGLIFSIHEIKWVSEKEIEAKGSYYEAGLSAAGYTYQSVKEQGKWIVRNQTMNWISSVPGSGSNLKFVLARPASIGAKSVSLQGVAPRILRLNTLHCVFRREALDWHSPRPDRLKSTAKRLNAAYRSSGRGKLNADHGANRMPRAINVM
jgi:hypothetical protein